MALNDKKIQALKPEEKQYKKIDSNCLYLIVRPNGKKVWWVKCTRNKESNEATLGHYPAMSLAKARAERDEYLKKLSKGINPAEEKRRQKLEAARRKQEEELTFAKVAEDFCRVKASRDSQKYHKTTLERLQLHILPFIGDIPFAKLTFDNLKSVALRLEQDGKFEMAYRVAVIINQICKHAKLCRWSEHNIADGITAVIAKRPKAEIKGHPAITDPEGVAVMLQRIQDYIRVRRVSDTMAAALQLFPLLALRSQELLGAEWQEVDFDKAVLSIPAERMKAKRPHDVPLSRQALSILQDLYSRRVNNRFIFRSGGKTGHYTSEAVNKAMHGAGIPLGDMCLHGWRKVFSTICNESGVPEKLVEKCLAHVSGDATAMAYNKAQHQQVRSILMQWWADTVDALRQGTERPRLELERAAMFA